MKTEHPPVLYGCPSAFDEADRENRTPLRRRYALFWPLMLVPAPGLILIRFLSGVASSIDGNHGWIPMTGESPRRLAGFLGLILVLIALTTILRILRSPSRKR